VGGWHHIQPSGTLQGAQQGCNAYTHRLADDIDHRLPDSSRQRIADGTQDERASRQPYRSDKNDHGSANNYAERAAFDVIDDCTGPDWCRAELDSCIKYQEQQSVAIHTAVPGDFEELIQESLRPLLYALPHIYR
jgi:hypothetical protein